VNFTNTLLLALLSVAIFAASCGLRATQRAAEKAGRLRAANAPAAATPTTEGKAEGGATAASSSVAVAPSPAAPDATVGGDAGGRGLSFAFTGASLTIGGKPILTDVTGRVPSCSVTGETLDGGVREWGEGGGGREGGGG
jgi:hypothetical protein